MFVVGTVENLANSVGKLVCPEQSVHSLVLGHVPNSTPWRSISSRRASKPSRSLDFAVPSVVHSIGGVQRLWRRDWVVEICADAIAVALALVLPGNWHLVLAGLAASGVGALVLPVEEAA